MPGDDDAERSRAATHKLIAEKAGVHPSTVSRILRREPRPRRSDFAATEARVREIAESLGYRPDLTAASLRTRRSRVIGVLLPQLHDVVLATILSGVDSGSFGHGYQTIVTNTSGDQTRRRARLEMLLSRRVDGLIIGDATVGDDLFRELEQDRMPVVLVNHRHGGQVSVTGNDELGGRLAAEHLLGMGHVDVGVIAGPPYPVAYDRVEGFRKAFADAGAALPPQRMVRSTFDADGGRAATETLLAQGSTPTAIFAVNDSAAIGAMGCLRDHGLTTGSDVAIVGYNDIAISKDLPIPLSSVRAPLRDMGERAADLLVELIDGGLPGPVELSPTIMVRGSSSRRSRGDAPRGA